MPFKFIIRKKCNLATSISFFVIHPNFLLPKYLVTMQETFFQKKKKSNNKNHCKLKKYFFNDLDKPGCNFSTDCEQNYLCKVLGGKKYQIYNTSEAKAIL